jgi:adenine-specific DNA-methyltransferase
LNTNPKSILEPSCGDGIFAKAIHNNDKSQSVHLNAFELFESECQKAASRFKQLKIKNTLINGDFLEWAIPKMIDSKTPFDGVVGNPPFVRYQYLPPVAQSKSEKIFKLLNLKFTKHTNAWVPFVLASLSLLRPGGRMGLILPAEIIHVMHAQSLRNYLGEHCSRLLIIDPEEIWFEGTLQGAVILFAEKKEVQTQHSLGLGIYKVSGKSFMEGDPEFLFDSIPRINGETVEGKWTRAFLTQEERDIYKQIIQKPEVYKFNDIASVDVGIVTGANKYFLVNDETVERYELKQYAHPMFGRSEHCPGVIYDIAQHKVNSLKGSPTNFILLDGKFENFPTKVQEYIKLGEEENLHIRYKCGMRKTWYTVPSVYASKIGMLKRSHHNPKLILNEIGAYTTDTAYRVKVSENTSPEKLVFCFGTSLTALSAELEGRHYGGGVLELVPSEIEKLQIAIPENLKSFDLIALDKKFKNINGQDVVVENSKVVLGALGLSNSEQDTLNNAWLKLKNRRHRVPS